MTDKYPDIVSTVEGYLRTCNDVTCHRCHGDDGKGENESAEGIRLLYGVLFFFFPDSRFSACTVSTAAECIAYISNSCITDPRGVS